MRIEKLRYNSKLCLPALVIVGFFLISGPVTEAGAGDWKFKNAKFTNLSLIGDYAFTGIGLGGTSPNAAVGVLQFNGLGRFKGTKHLNQPGPVFPQRIYEVLTLGGTYEVEPRGTGVIRDKDTGEERLRFVITETYRFCPYPRLAAEEPLRFATAEASWFCPSYRLAKEIVFLPLDLIEETGSLVLLTATKRPDIGKFTPASLHGTYAFRGIGRGGTAPEAGVGTIAFDGKGNAFAFDVLNLPGASPGERQVIRFPFEAGYTIGHNGIGTITQVGGISALFVITSAKLVNGIKVADEVALIISSLSTEGNLVTDLLQKISSSLPEEIEE